MRYVGLRHYILDLATGLRLPLMLASGRSRKHPHGFIGRARVMGVHRAFKLGLISFEGGTYLDCVYGGRPRVVGRKLVLVRPVRPA